MSERELYLQLGQAVARRRRALGMSQAQVAEKIGLTRASLANLENGRQRLMLHHLYRLASALQLSSILELAPASWKFDDGPVAQRFEGSKLTPREEVMVGKFLRSVINAETPGKQKR